MVFWGSRSCMLTVLLLFLVPVVAVFIFKAIKDNTKDKMPSHSSKLDLCSC